MAPSSKQRGHEGCHRTPTSTCTCQLGSAAHSCISAPFKPANRSIVFRRCSCGPQAADGRLPGAPVSLSPRVPSLYCSLNLQLCPLLCLSLTILLTVTHSLLLLRCSALRSMGDFQVCARLVHCVVYNPSHFTSPVHLCVHPVVMTHARAVCHSPPRPHTVSLYFQVQYRQCTRGGVSAHVLSLSLSVSFLNVFYALLPVVCAHPFGTDTAHSVH